MKQLFESFLKDLQVQGLHSLRRLQSSFGFGQLVYADVGATGGTSTRWKALGSDHLMIYSFDPDSRAENLSQSGKVFATALGQKRGNVQLYLTKFAPASSIYVPNKKLLDCFANSDAHDIVGTIDVELQTMDEALSGCTPPDFIKVDAEGADFDILVGATKIIDHECLGVQVEVQFLERNIGSKLFGDVDNFLKSKGFKLYDLRREWWVHQNRKFSGNSRSQLVWADALYLISSEKLIEICKIRDLHSAKQKICKAVVVSVLYQAHEHAFDCLEACRKHGLINEFDYLELCYFINKNMRDGFSILIREILFLGISIFILPIAILDFKNKGRYYQYFLTNTLSFLFTLERLVLRAKSPPEVMNDPEL